MQAMQQSIEPSGSPSSLEPQPDLALRMRGPILGDRQRETLDACLPLLIPALESDGWKLNVEDVRELVANGGFQLWVIFDAKKREILAAILSEILEYPRKKVFSLAFCGGHHVERWSYFIGSFAQAAMSQGCHALRIAGRPGWARIFPQMRERARILETDLEVE